MKKLYPNIYLNKVEDITIQTLIKNKIKLIILDVDNTLIDYYKNLSENIINWAKGNQGGGRNKESIKSFYKTLVRE